MNAPPLRSEKLSRLSTSDGELPIQVLLVEDSRTVRLQMRQYISLLDNVTLLEAGTLAEARAILEGSAQDLFCAVLDLTLPDATGLETVEAVRQHGVPIIVLTGSVDPCLRQAVLDLRVIDYMFKNGPRAIEDVAYLIGRLRQNRSMKVMVVDDSRTFRMHVTGLLAQYRFQILGAGSGEEALTLLEQHPDVALVLTDYHMPGMSGLDLVRDIRRSQRREDLAIIALSDNRHPELSAAMLKAGANDYLNKQFQVEEFFCRLLQNVNMVRFVRELRDLGNRDYLTRLYNRRYLFQAAEALLADAREQGRTLAVAMVDADHFKRINDQHGHSAGDEALRQLAGVLRRAHTRPDLVARYGGEEFVCVRRVDTAAEACRHFDALRVDIEALDFNWNGVKIPLTVSIGLTCTPRPSFPELIEQADEAVYRAKAGGRNRVVMQPGG